MLLYLVFQLARLLLPLLPERLTYALATGAGDLAYLLYAPGRRVVRDNLRHVLGPNVSPGRLRRTTREVFRTTARNYVNLFLLPQVDLDTLDRQVLWQGLPYFEEALARGQGMVLAGAHLGSFDILSQLAAHRGTPLAVLVEPLRQPQLFRLVAGLRSSLGLRMLPTTPAGIKTAIKLLRAGGVVGILCDRDIQHRGLRLDFFGEEASLPTGAVELALRTGAALVPCFGLRLGFRRYAICFEPPLDLPEGEGLERDPALVRTHVVRLAQIIESYVRKYPGQWVVFERIWPDATPQQRARSRLNIKVSSRRGP
ncbi:MAG: lysophospholipid acyltransferase family protein [Chloroflexi bacterium]|nr:lysophospholipid acyltransferase family protein [Chloroflexota bacterium]